MKKLKTGDQIEVQVCDGRDGCGDVIKAYKVPQSCRWQNHDRQPKYAGKVKNAPRRRRFVVQIVRVLDGEIKDVKKAKRQKHPHG